MMIKPGASGPQEGHFDLRGLRLFLTVAEARSMTEAAKRAGTSQSAVSQAMARLEVNCGAALFERGARPLRLTPAGEVLAKGVPALLRAEAELRRRLAGERDTAAEALRLGLVDSFAATVGPELIRRLRGHSERITVLSGISPTLWADMQDRRLDFMVLTDPAGRIDGMRQHTILSEPYVLLLPKRLADNIEIPSLKDLAATHPFIRYSIRSHIGTQVEEHLARQGISPRASMEFDGTDALFAMVSAGLGWALTTPLCYAHGRARAEDLVVLPLPGKAFSRSFYMVAAPAAPAEAEARIVEHARGVARELIETEIAPWLPWAVPAMKAYD
jgi:DNA-binding transcriptional LysR family regulator